MEINWFLILEITFYVVAGLDILNYSLLRLGMIEKREYMLSKEVHGVSMIVCFKNEEENIRKHMDMWIRQIGVKDWELLLVNDGSTDNSLDIINEKREGRENLIRILEIDQNQKKGVGKKYALKYAVENAKYDNIVVTDADCLPASNKWLKIISDKLGRSELVLGISPYKYHGGFVNALIGWEALNVILQYIGLANLGRAYMGVGRNMAFKKEVFVRYNHFDEHYDIPSGDDDIFVNNAVRSGVKHTVSFSKDSFMYAEPVKGFGAYWKQKTRHLRAGGKYNSLDLLLLSYLFFVPLFYYSLFISNIILNISLFKLFMVFVIKETVMFAIFNSVNKFNWKNTNWNLSTIYRILSLIIQIFALAKNLVSPSKKWK